MVRTAARQLESHLPGPGGGGGLRKGRTRAQTRALSIKSTRMIVMIGSDEGGKLLHRLLTVHNVTREPSE